MAESYKLTYFNMRGLGEPVRLLFAYAEVPYEDNRIERDQWPEHKQSFPWGQLPVLQVGDKTLCQSNAIGRYLAKKYNLVGENDWEAAKMDEFVDAINDIRTEWRKSFMEQDATKKAELTKVFLETIVPKYFTKFEAQVNAEDGPYMVGKKISWLDIQMACFLEFFEVQHPGIVETYSGLKKLQDIVLAVPQIKTWIDKRPVTAF